MKVALPDGAGTTQFYEEDLMGEFEQYEQPGIDVVMDDDGTRYVRVVQEVGEQLIENRDGYSRYDDGSSSDSTTDSDSGEQ